MRVGLVTYDGGPLHPPRAPKAFQIRVVAVAQFDPGLGDEGEQLAQAPAPDHELTRLSVGGFSDVEYHPRHRDGPELVHRMDAIIAGRIGAERLFRDAYEAVPELLVHVPKLVQTHPVHGVGLGTDLDVPLDELQPAFFEDDDRLEGVGHLPFERFVQFPCLFLLLSHGV